MSENKFFKQAKEELAYLSGEENFKFLVHDRAMFLMDQDAREKQGFSEGVSIGKAQGHASGKAEGLAEGLAEGHASGKAEGQKEKQIEIARKMKSKNISIDDISEFTGLSKKEIEEL